MLLPQHQRLIDASAIAADVAAARGYRSVTTKAELVRLGFGDRQAIVPTLLVPVWDAWGNLATYQHRPDAPRVVNGRALKYETPSGGRMVLDVPPGARAGLGCHDRPLFVTEGCRKADAAVSAGLCCVALLGVWNWRGTNAQGGRTALADWETVDLKNGREVYVAFDSDVMLKRAVRVALDRLAGFLRGAGAVVRFVLLPPKPDGSKQGLDDFLAAGHTVADLLAHAVDALPAQEEDGKDDDDDDRPSEADVLVRLARQHAELFHDRAGELYATIERDGHKETWPLKATAFRRWLVGAFYALGGKAPHAQAVADAMNVLQAVAQFEGGEHPVYVRVAPDGAGGLYLDLGDPAWRAVHVTAAGWEVVAAPPVRFRRSPGSGALPEPVRAGRTVDDLRGFLNVPAAVWPLLRAWLVAALCDRGPYPVLEIRGEQGSGKSVAARMLRRFVDPATPELRSDPREVRDLVIAARSTWLVAFDNVSRVPDWLSDALCRLATGGGWATRELYTDADEVLFEAKRPVLLNGITDFIVRDDLRERTISVVLPAIAEEERREERALWAEFEEASPGIFAALLDYLAGAIRALPSVNLDRLPRMADFATWAVAAERGAGLADGGSSPFLAAYEEGRAAAREAAIEGSAVGPFLVQFLRARGHWTGTAGELLGELDALAGPKATARGWPRRPRSLADELRRLAPALRGNGYTVELPERSGHDRRRTWTLGTPPSSEEAGTASSASSASPAPSSRGPAGADEADAGADEAHGRLRPHRPRSSACEPAPDLRPRGEGPGSNGRYPFGSDPPGPAADADEADEAIPHSSNGGAWESSRGPAGAADEADAPIPGFSDEGGAWDWERVTEAMYREYVAWRNATPAAWGWPPTSPEARAAAAWDDAYAAGDLGRLRRAHAACLACRAEPAEPVSRPPGVPLGVGQVDRTVYQELVDAGVPREEAKERARVDDAAARERARADAAPKEVFRS